KPALDTLVERAAIDKQGVFVAMAALNAIDTLDTKVVPIADALRKLPEQGKLPHLRYAGYVPRLLADIKANLK
ncbi:MAG TPA: hypothetical protein VKU02_14865, partial [Gemmataceae bacterium]|nr:hypothetical protein [Gemmataceae bacterium]